MLRVLPSIHRGGRGEVFGTANPVALYLFTVGSVFAAIGIVSVRQASWRVPAGASSINPEGYVLTHKNYGFTNSPLKVNVPRPVPPPSKGFPWSGNVVSVSVPVARSWSGSKLIV